ncbi:MAG: nucleotidyl transferase AbiEii/AbiGii toxin family protein [Thiohalorhabdus sp.]|uniref:nucleotidyl transferase AbiEii/AbiGii toxin family protein n=1 Tax=Thiohalorhabdus sp. TaxID=3094134 RepID=UPI0039801797
MAPTNFTRVFDALNAAGVRYVVVGGLATVLHGLDRLTADIDLVVDLEPGNARRAVEALLASGFRAGAPVDPRDFADPARRREWVEREGLRVFSFWDASGSSPTVDLFVEPPLPFEGLWQRARDVELPDGRCHLASLEDLIALKEATGRESDREDARRLREIEQRMGHDPKP